MTVASGRSSATSTGVLQSSNKFFCLLLLLLQNPNSSVVAMRMPTFSPFGPSGERVRDGITFDTLTPKGGNHRLSLWGVQCDRTG